MEDAVVAAQKGRYRITADDTGVYLTVWAAAQAGWTATQAAVMQELADRQCTNFDSNFIAVTIREAIGKPVLIVNTGPEIAGRYEISANDTGVYLSVWASGNGGKPVSTAAVIADLTERQCTNFDSNFIAAVIRDAVGTPTLIVNTLPKCDGRYEISANDAGLYLSVWAPGKDGWPVSQAVIIQDLTNRKCTNFDEGFISVVIREAVGQPVLIASSQTAGLASARPIRVKVGFERLEARISINLPADKRPATLAELLGELQAAGVCYGIDEEALAMLTRTHAATNVICARGTPPCPGDNAFLQYYVDPDCQGRPVELEDGRVDFKETNNFLCVEEGQLLVEKVPATAGKPGTDVFGLPLPAKPGHDLPMPVGKNVINVDDWRLYAAINGHLHIFLDKRVNVLPIIIIDGDVDYGTGNIDFKGSVIVKGSVQPDFFIKAGGNVEVCGTISGAMVEAANIIVRKGIQGMKRSIIKARERLVANFIENATVYADEDVIVHDVILTSSVYAGSRVIVEGGRGLIRGGRISAGELVRASIIGNQSGVVTEIDVAVNSLLRDELVNLRQQIKKAEARYNELRLAITHLQQQGPGAFANERQERYKKQELEYKVLPERLEGMRQQIMNIEYILKTAKPGRIRVSGYIHPGTRVSIGSLTRNINDSLRFVSFYAAGGQITFSPLR